jgi:hypothetical protein
MEQKATSTVTKGLVISLIMIVCSLGIYFAGMEINSPLKWLSYCIYIIGIIASILQYGKQIDHNSTFGNYFAHGFKIAAVVTVIMVIYMVVFVWLFPDFKEKVIDEARKAMNERENTSDEQKAQAIEMTKKLFMVFVVGGTLIYNIIVGAIASLIGAAVAKKNPRPLEEIN